MPDILETIADATRIRVQTSKKSIALEAIREQALSLPKSAFLFEKALKKMGFPLFVSVKKLPLQKA